MVSSLAIRPALAPASTAMFDSVSRPAMSIPSMAGPPNSSALYVAPSAPSDPMMVSMRSLAATPAARAPRTSMRSVSGTRSQVLPLAMPTATSVEPIPVAKAASAPAVHVCESAPMTRSPGFA